MDALVTAQKAQQDAATAQAALAKALADAATSTSGSTGGSSGGGSGSTGSSGGSTSGGSTSGGSTGSSGGATGSSGGSTSGGSTSAGSATSAAARVAQDKVTVTSSQAAVTTGEANLAAATLTAPISGTIASSDLVKGQTASSSDSIVIVGKGSTLITVDVPLASLPKVKVGQRATVTANGATTAVTGKVASISLLPTSTSTSSTATATSTTTSSTVTYPVVVSVAMTSASLASGSSASVGIVLNTVKNAIVVPVSALDGATAGARSTVSVLAGGVVTSKQVTVGAIGSQTVQVSGLNVGDRVVLADTSAAVPTSSSATTTAVQRRFAATGGSALTGGTGASGFTGGAGGGFGGPPGG